MKRKSTNFNIVGIWNQIEKVSFILLKKINIHVSWECQILTIRSPGKLRQHYKDKTKNKSIAYLEMIITDLAHFYILICDNMKWY